MNFVVVGGNGFIGRHFVARLLERGHSVTVVSRGPSREQAGVNVVSGGIELLCARPDLLEAADAVCHLASATIPATSSADPLREIDGNLRPTIMLLESMLRNGNRRILFISSGGAVYGVTSQVPIHEDHPTEPISPYGITKLAIENYLSFYAAQHNFSPIIIRPANPYGPEQGKLGQLGAVWTFLSMIRNGQRATLWGDGSTVRDFVHVDDLTRLMITALEQKEDGVYNCGGGGSGTSLRELISIIEEASGRVLELDRKPARPFDPPAVVLDISKAWRDLGWKPRIGLAEGIERMLVEKS